MRMKEMLKKTIVEAINLRKLNETDVCRFELYVIPYDDIPAVCLNVYTSGDADAKPEPLDLAGFPFGWGDTFEVMEQWATGMGFSDHDMEDDEHYEQIEKLYNGIEILLREIADEIREEKIITKRFGEEIPIDVHVGALGEPGLERVSYSIKIYNEKRLYLEGIYLEDVLFPENEMSLIRKNEDRLLDTIFDGDFSAARVMEFLKTRVKPDIRSCDPQVIYELMRTGGKMYDDDISVVINYYWVK